MKLPVLSVFLLKDESGGLVDLEIMEMECTKYNAEIDTEDRKQVNCSDRAVIIRSPVIAQVHDHQFLAHKHHCASLSCRLFAFFLTRRYHLLSHFSAR